MIVAGVDPGNTIGLARCGHYGIQQCDEWRVREGAQESSARVAFAWLSGADVVVIERMTPRAIIGRDMLRGAEICGGLALSCLLLGQDVYLIPRPSVCAILTGSARAKKPQVKEAVLSILGPKPKKGQVSPRWTEDGASGVVGHAWDALALCVAYNALNEAEREQYRFTGWDAP